MRTSRYLLSTLREIPTHTDTVSHQLMLRAGMVRKLASGLYSWMPTGLRVLRKVENIIREEMNNVGAIEIAMPIVQPADLWKRSGRWNQHDEELIHFKDRNSRIFLLSPTHEEVITEIIRNEIYSYKQLPLNLYQIHTKIRNEIRPRFGPVRAREFVMKDAYSFHTNQASLQKTYNIMRQVYSTIFTRMGLEFRSVQADTGSIGGSISHEFQVIADIGEDNIAFSTESDYASNINLVEVVTPVTRRPPPREKMRSINTPINLNISELLEQLVLPIEKTVKMSLVKGCEDAGCSFVALMVRGDHQLNNIKVEKLPQVASPLTFLNTEEVSKIVNSSPNLSWLIKLPLIIDQSVATMSDFAVISNINGKHFLGVNWERDLPLPPVADLRNVVEGDFSPDGKGLLKIKRGIEVGHIFQLGTKYSDAMGATFQDKDGCNKILTMGCYGIGITRAIAATVEQRHDKNGILWPEALAPFNVALLPINMHKSFRVKETTENLYHQLKEKGIDVLLDDRKERLGVMLSDMDLIGVPHQLIISERNLNTEVIEYKSRFNGQKKIIKLRTIITYLISKIFNSNKKILK